MRVEEVKLADRTEAREAKARLGHLLRNESAVNGIGLTQKNGSWAIKVNLQRDDEAVRELIPKQVSGVSVIIEVSGAVTGYW